MTFNRMGTVPLPLALHLASYTVLGLFCFFAGALNLIDPGKIPHGIMFLLVCGFSWGYVFGILMARKEVVMLGFLASAAWLDAGPRVLDHEPHPPLARLGGELNDGGLPPFDHVLRVGHEVDHHLLQLLPESEHRRRGLIEPGTELHVVGAQYPLPDLGDVVNQVVDLHPR